MRVILRLASLLISLSTLANARRAVEDLSQAVVPRVALAKIVKLLTENDKTH